jgi:GT2 family glycosyltransferase
MDKSVAIILVNYLDYAERFLDDCLAGLRAQDYQGEMKIFIVDNATTAASFTYLSKKVPEAELVLNKSNDGFAKGNNDGIKLALAQNFDYVFLLNEDTVIEQNCISELVKVFENENWIPDQVRDDKREVGAVQARMVLFSDKSKINSLGNTTHFLGFGYCDGYNQSITNYELQITKKESCHSGAKRSEAIESQDDHTNDEMLSLRSSMTDKDICYPSGAAVMFRSSVLKEIGLFDEEMWMYNEDQDLGWRVWLAGYKCVLAWDAVVYHKYEFSRSITKYYWMDRNRIVVMLKNYRLGTLLLIFPAFLVMELGLILFATKGGWLKEKLKVWQYFLHWRTWQCIIKSRRTTQVLRKVKDRDIIAMFSGKIWYQEIDDVKLRLVNPIFNFYWKIVRTIIFW